MKYEKAIVNVILLENEDVAASSSPSDCTGGVSSLDACTTTTFVRCTRTSDGSGCFIVGLTAPNPNAPKSNPDDTF